MNDVQQQFVQVGERRVFVRHAGSGPAVVLLHQSPESSVSLLPWFERLAGRFAVFAPDTPGFGLSDPLPLAQPSVPDLAAALVRLLDALSLERVLLYGVHTGAAIAARVARDHPQRVAALVCDGLSAFTRDERRPLLDGYLPPFEPAWDGTHLLWLWARMREQFVFFPWHAGTAATRIAYPMPSPALIHKCVMEVLDAGDGYRAGYRAPLLYEHGAAGAAQLTVPARLLYRRADVLRPHLDRLPALPPDVQAREVADADALAAETEAAFDAAAHRVQQIDSDTAVDAAVSPTRRIVAGDAGRLAFWCSGDAGAALTELTLPEIGTPAAPAIDLAPGLRGLAMDWPGHGASSGWTADAVASARWLDAAVHALDALGAGTVRLRATGGACALAAALAQRLGARCAGTHFAEPLALTAAERHAFIAELPDLEPTATGAHLIAAWNWARFKHLFRAGGGGAVEAVITAPAPPPRRVHADTVEMLRAGPLFAALSRAALPP